MQTVKETKMIHAIICISFLVGLLAWGIVLNGLSPQVLLLTSAMFSAAVGIFVLKYTWTEIEAAIFEALKISMIAVIILIVVGALIGTWMLGGIVPSMIYYGMKILNPQFFFVSALLMCSIAALGTGSSWSTMATVGVALIGISEGLQLPKEITAGAIISGSYFGDKLSPLSDTSNLSCACAGSKLIDHIKHMQWSSIPAYIITLILFTILGFTAVSPEGADSQHIAEILSVIDSHFVLSPWFLLVPVLVIVLVVTKIPAIPGLFIGALLGGIVAISFQGSAIIDVANVMLDGFSIETGSSFIDDLLSRGGMMSMMFTVLLIMCAMILGGVLEKIGVIQVITNKILSLAKSVGDLTVAVVGSCIFVNLVAADQYLSLILPGNMFKHAYIERNIHPKNLSRTLQDSGTVTSVFIPWNTCGAFMMAALGVEPWIYVPFAFFNWLSPLFSIIYAYMGWSMTPLDEE